MTQGWRRYIEPQGFSAEDAALIARALDDIWATPEGQDLIIRAHENQGMNDGKFVIQNNPDSHHEGEGNNAGNMIQGLINLNLDEIARIEFPTAAGGWRRTSITETLVHEIFHLADKNVTADVVRASQQNLFGIVDHLTTRPETLTQEQERDVVEALLPRLMARLRDAGLDIDLATIQGIQRAILAPENAEPEYLRYIDVARDLFNDVANNRSLAVSIAEETGIPNIRFRTTNSEEIVELASSAYMDVFRNARLPREEMATDYTDYFMLRWFGIEPRENYIGARLSETPADITNLPERRWFPEWDYGRYGYARVVQEAREYLLGGPSEGHEGSLGDMEKPQLPANIAQDARRR